jgi:hypothetical protein
MEAMAGKAETAELEAPARQVPSVAPRRLTTDLAAVAALRGPLEPPILRQEAMEEMIVTEAMAIKLEHQILREKGKGQMM